MNRRTFIKTVAGIFTSAAVVSLGVEKTKAYFPWTWQYLDVPGCDFDRNGIKFRVLYHGKPVTWSEYQAICRSASRGLEWEEIQWRPQDK